MKVILLIIAPVVIIGLLFVFKTLSGENERIKTFLRLYKAAKKKLTDFSERELLEIVTEEHIPPGRSKRLKDCAITGRQYLDNVFEQKQIDINELIYHLITLEFPNKYKPFTIDLEKMLESDESDKSSVEEQLKATIAKYKANILR